MEEDRKGGKERGMEERKFWLVLIFIAVVKDYRQILSSYRALGKSII